MLLPLVALGLTAAASAAPAWRFVETGGVWWLQAPDGSRMLSRGVDCIGPGPDGKDFNPANPAYAPATRGGEAFEPWQGRTLARLKRWGFNTAAGWSDARWAKDGLPSTPVLHLGVQLGAPWGDLHRLRVVAGSVTVCAAAGLTAAPGAKEEDWRPVVWAVPPAAGQPSAAIAAGIDRWHYVWEVAIPASALGNAPLAAGRKLTLSLTVENRGDLREDAPGRTRGAPGGAPLTPHPSVGQRPACSSRARAYS